MIFAESAGIASHRFGSLHADESHADGRTQSRQTDVDAAAHISANIGITILTFLYFCLLCPAAPAIEHGQAAEIA